MIKLDYGDYDGQDVTDKLWCVEHKTVEKLLQDMQSGTLQRQCRAVVEHSDFPILMVEGHWAQSKGNLLGTGFTWEQAWNQLQTLQDMGMRLQLTTSEAHTIQRLFELEAYFLKETHPSASRHLSGSPTIAALCLIEGIGEAKANALEAAFGSLGCIAGAGDSKLLAVHGIGEALVARIVEFFWGKQ